MFDIFFSSLKNAFQSYVFNMNQLFLMYLKDQMVLKNNIEIQFRCSLYFFYSKTWKLSKL